MAHALTASCALLDDDVGADGSLRAYPGSIVLDAGGGQRTAVMWLPETSTAAFVFADDGSRAQALDPADYSQLAPLWQGAGEAANGAAAEDELSNALGLDAGEFERHARNAEGGYGGTPEVSAAYLDAFRAARSAGGANCSGLEGCLRYASAGAQPAAVVCGGQGAGGGTAGVCAAWAALRFPRAQVVWANAGSPQPVGNPPFYRLLAVANGAHYTAVNGLDPVPRAGACARNASAMSLPGVAIYYPPRATGDDGGGERDDVAHMQADDPYFANVDCSYFDDEPKGRPALPDSSCAAYLEQVLRSSVVAPIRLGPQEPFVVQSEAGDEAGDDDWVRLAGLA